ncbi:coniferyl aldehyde dehydrogenase [Vibrio intestinalis]|uniref:coniferyl aldehyde dehydrogenase n=1 Tax=Vibrio intestinalis TaxID=2933291 RepID=UPI0021A91643|nr:coniferyl aldehyde dehydrogenase [Vibrio intestinalis]
MEKVVDLNLWHKAHVKSAEELQQLFEQKVKQFQSEPNSKIELRLERLELLKQAILQYKDELVDALGQDYGFRNSFESLICDIVPSVDHINFTQKRLKKWAKPSKRQSGLLLSPSKVKVVYQPLGVVGVIVPWNFPVFLSLGPIVTALAAGNQVMVKLSEYTPHTNQVLREIFNCLASYITVVEGDVEIAQSFSELPFDHLLFTGSTQVGVKVAQAAAKNLTPVTLELGGKSPVIIADDANFNRAIDAILFGKSSNAGQICVAPDYVLLPKGRELEFIQRYISRFRKAYLKKESADSVTHIINQGQYDRLQGYLDNAKQLGASVYTIDEVATSDQQMLPHFLTGVTDEMAVMQNEIFGPILPVIGYQTMQEALDYVTSRPRPLALYLMSKDKKLQQRVLEVTHSGGVCFNDTLFHVTAHDAPFGGIGNSGMGHYHGQEGFATFSKARTVLSTPTWLPRSWWLSKQAKWLKLAMSRLFLR